MAINQQHALSLLSDSELANIFDQDSFYDLCSAGLRGTIAAQVRIIVMARSAAGIVSDCNLLSVLHQFFNGDPANEAVQMALVSLCHDQDIISPETYTALMTAIEVH